MTQEREGQTTAEGCAEIQCVWLTDSYGLSWQIVPSVLYRMMVQGDAEKTERVVRAMLKMIKLEIDDSLTRAYEGEGEQEVKNSNFLDRDQSSCRRLA